MTTRRAVLSVFPALALLLAACGGEQGSAPANAPAPAAVSVAPPASGIALFAGGLGGFGTLDASATSARFQQPLGVAVGSDGARYVSDGQNHTIRKISAAGEVTTLAGAAGVPGAADGSGGTARFRNPGAIAVAADGTVYVGDRGNYTLRRISPAGEVSTLAGVAGVLGAVDGTGADARLGVSEGLVVASDGTVYFTDAGNRLIRKATPAGVVTTLAGSAGAAGSADGTGAAARFGQPAGIAVDGDGNLLVADTVNHTLRKITPAGVVTTVAGMAGSPGLADGSGATVRFRAPYGVAAGSGGQIFVSDALNLVVRQLDAAGAVTTLASVANVPDAGVQAAPLAGLAVDADGSLLVADPGNHRLLRVALAGAVSQAFGAAPRPGAIDATADAARFSAPAALAAAADGTVYVADTANHVIRKISPAGVASTVAGLAGAVGSGDGTGSAARFSSPAGIAVALDGTVYVADTGNHAIRRISAAGEVTLLAGLPGSAGAGDGAGSGARFDTPRGLALEGSGQLLVADSGNHTLRRITAAGVVSTVAGLAGSAGAIDGSGSAARLNLPWAVAVADDGTAYLSDQQNHLVRKITPAGVVSTLAGSAGASGDADGSGGTARFRAPAGLVLDADGNLFVVDRDSHALRKITPAGVVSTVAGRPGHAGVLTGALPGGLNLPLGLALGPAGELFATSENAVLRITFDPPLPVFGVGLWASQSALVEGGSLQLGWSARHATNCQASGDWSGAQAVAGSATLAPGAVGTYTYTLTCDEDGGGASKSATVVVTVSPPLPTLSLTASSVYVTPGASVTLTWSAANVTACSAAGAWSGVRATSGSEAVAPPTGNQSFTLTCTGPGGATARNVNVSVAWPPVVTLSASAAEVETGKPLTLTWSVTNASACSATGSWSGARATSGSEAVTAGAVGATAYTLICSGAGGSDTRTVNVTVTPAAVAAAGGGGGGGSADLAGLLLLGALALRRRR